MVRACVCQAESVHFLRLGCLSQLLLHLAFRFAIQIIHSYLIFVDVPDDGLHMIVCAKKRSVCRD